MSSLELGVIGNCSYGALIDRRARMVWCCLPRFDGDPVFSSLLNDDSHDGVYSIDLENAVRTEQNYIENTAVLATRLFDSNGNAVEITDFAPRFLQLGRMFRPMCHVRRVRPISGSPRVQIRLRPRFDWGASAPEITHGSNHIRYVSSGLTFRVTTNAPVTYVLNETPFILEEPVSFILGPDETLSSGIEATALAFQEQTTGYWRRWVRRLALPLEWQEAVIRAAVTLKLCSFEETGAIIAAMTTSVPEAAHSGRNWDYRYCWLRDGFFVVRALNSLAEVGTMEDYLRYLRNIASTADGSHLQPVFGIGLEDKLIEREVTSLAGYRGMGPVRVGNQAHEHSQHDVYGNVILATSQAFFDKRLFRPGNMEDFHRLETIGEQAVRLHDQPDAGMWELRTRARVHTSSSLMCWAACDRLAKIARHLGLEDRAAKWHTRAVQIHGTIVSSAWNSQRQAFMESFGGDTFDASLLLMAEVGFLDPSDPKFVSTVDGIEQALRRGKHLFRYAAADDFGEPENAFNICTFWYIDALARLGRIHEAREIFESMLAARNRLGLLSEDTDPISGELWGNFPQTYSLVGIINGAMRLSERWEETV